MTYKNLNAVILEVYKPKSPDEQKFVDKHVTIKHKDRNGNGDDVFNGNTKYIKRKGERHGYDVGEDEKVYESIEELDEDSDQIHELSRDTLSNYAGKASDARGHRNLPTKKVDNRYKGVATAGKKLDSYAKEEVEDIDSLLDEALDLLNSIDEKTLTPAELKKREEIVKAVKRGDPKMDKSMAYAIATKTAKRVAEESTHLQESEVDYNNYTITASPHSSPKHELGVVHVNASSGKMKALGIHTEKGGKYGRTSHVTVTNKTTGERSHHNVYQREWSGGGLTASIRALHKPHPEHHNVLHHFLAGRKVVNPNRAPRLAEASLPGAYSDKVTMPQSKFSREQGATARSRYVSSNGKGLGPLPVKPMAKEEVELDEVLGGYEKAVDYIRKSDDSFSKGDDKTKMKRYLGAKMLARKQMAKEEAEQIDELSRDTVKRYKDTATKNLDYHAAAWDNIAQADANAKGFTKAQGASFKKHDSEAGKRYFGIKMANKKLAKEDIINSAYERYVPEEVKFTPQELFVNRLEALSESHADILMDLFESLSKENQIKMTQDAKTTEGLNKLLNFAIENRENV